MNALLLSLTAVLATSAGGFLAFRLRDHLQLVLVFASSAVLGVVCFELLPEIFEIENRIGSDGRHAMVMLAGGFLAVHALDRFTKHDGVHHCADAPRHQAGIGLVPAAAMVGHSFLDGVGIGVAFQVAPEVGLAFATGVVAHDFCDGLNTVGFVLAHGNSQKDAQRMLLLNAMAPVLGALSTLAFRLPPEALSACLGLFAGMLVRIGVAGVLPALRRTLLLRPGRIGHPDRPVQAPLCRCRTSVHPPHPRGEIQWWLQPRALRRLARRWWRRADRASAR